MINYKSCHIHGLDFVIYNYFKSHSFDKIYYLYIYDYCTELNEKLPINFYNKNNNIMNTWNYKLNYNSTTKKDIMKTSPLFGFSSYYYDNNDEYILAKAIGHAKHYNSLSQSHIVNKSTFEKNYDKNIYIGQKILRTSENENIELNVFVIRNLSTRKLNLIGILCVNNTINNINRKESNDVKFYKVNMSILGNYIDNFINYMNYINLDYGRVELIYDKHLKWCVIDINNSPGYGITGADAITQIIKLIHYDISGISNNINNLLKNKGYSI